MHKSACVQRLRWVRRQIYARNIWIIHFAIVLLKFQEYLNFHCSLMFFILLILDFGVANLISYKKYSYFPSYFAFSSRTCSANIIIEGKISHSIFVCRESSGNSSCVCVQGTPAPFFVWFYLIYVNRIPFLLKNRQTHYEQDKHEAELRPKPEIFNEDKLDSL